MKKEIIEFNFEEIVEFGVLFKHKVLNSYYDLYSGYLSKLQAEALDFICNNPGKNIKDLNLALSIDKQYGSKIVQVLIAENLIMKENSTVDRRTQVLFPTEHGICFLNKQVEESNKIFTKRSEGLSDEEKLELIKSFSTLNDLLSKI